MSNIPRIISAKDILEMKVESTPCLLDPIFPKVGLIALAGSSDTGKSSLMRQLCIDIVTGADSFIGYKINSRYKRVLYVSTEDGIEAISTLLRMQNKEYNHSSAKFGNLDYLFDSNNLTEDLKIIMSNHSYDLIVIDAFADIFGKDINQSNQVRCFLNDFSMLAEKYKCLIAFVHHTGKASELKAPNKNNLLGTQGFEAKMRLVAMLVRHPTNNHLRYFCIVKGNYLPEHIKTEALELRFDENMTFSRTGKRESIENLSKDDSQKQKEELVMKLYGEGKSQIYIAKTLGLSQSTVSRIINLVRYL